VASGGLLGAHTARGCWTALWTAIALLELEPANHAAAVPAAQLPDFGQDEPPAVAIANAAIADLVGDRGLAFAVPGGGRFPAIGWGVHSQRAARVALLAGIALAALGGWPGKTSAAC
jgi:hypothetical protein